MENLDLELSFSNDFSSWCPTDVIGWTARQMVEERLETDLAELKTDLAELKQSWVQRIPPHQYESPSSWLVSDDDESQYSGGLDALPEAYLNDAKAAVFEFGTYAPNRDGTVTHDDAKDRTDYDSIRSIGHHEHSGTTSTPHSTCSSPSEVLSPTPASSAARRRRKRIINAQQRLAANVRERKRMTCMNAAFDSLRQRMPASNYDRRRSRIDILKSAVSYIQFLTGILKTV